MQLVRFAPGPFRNDYRNPVGFHRSSSSASKPPQTSHGRTVHRGQCPRLFVGSVSELRNRNAPPNRGFTAANGGGHRVAGRSDRSSWEPAPTIIYIAMNGRATRMSQNHGFRGPEDTFLLRLGSAKVALDEGLSGYHRRSLQISDLQPSPPQLQMPTPEFLPLLRRKIAGELPSVA